MKKIVKVKILFSEFSHHFLMSQKNISGELIKLPLWRAISYYKAQLLFAIERGSEKWPLREEL